MSIMDGSSASLPWSEEPAAIGGWFRRAEPPASGSFLDGALEETPAVPGLYRCRRYRRVEIFRHDPARTHRVNHVASFVVTQREQKQGFRLSRCLVFFPARGFQVPFTDF